ncbi:MAG: signal recognition particle-docking protein FtsY [Ilumatobacteraceae bacterium]
MVVLFGVGVVMYGRRSRTKSSEPAMITAIRTPGPLAKVRGVLSGAVSGLMRRSEIDNATWTELEEALLVADIGVRVTTELINKLRKLVDDNVISSSTQLVDALRSEMKSRLEGTNRALNFDPTIGGPNIWLMVGVNGSGKTTTIGKMSAQQVAAGRSVLVAAGDTFRAAAVDQLATWAQRSGAELVRGAEGSDPSSVIFDAVQRAHSRKIDLVIADTAGRLQSNTNLMEELKKVRRVAEKDAGKVTEVLLVIDATTGQNGLVQARQFAQATQVTGVVLSKLDGSAKGGIVFAIETELDIPVKLVGLGESIDDLAPFNPNGFIDSLFDES